MKVARTPRGAVPIPACGRDTSRMVDVTARGGLPAPTGSAAGDGSDQLRADIRLLGRVLGDVIRDQAGEAAFALVERTRVEALRLRREGGAPDALVAHLAGLDHRDALHVVRAFSHFSLLANLAEDLDEDRRARRDRLAERPPAPGTLARALERIDAAPPGRRSGGGGAAGRAREPGDDRAPHRGAPQDRVRGAATGGRPDPPARPHRPRPRRAGRLGGARCGGRC